MSPPVTSPIRKYETMSYVHTMPRESTLVRLATLGNDLRRWYPKAIQEIETVCRLEKWDTEYFTGLLCATSPRVSVRRSIRQALLYVTQGEYFDNFPRTIRTCVELWRTEHRLRGQKIEAFRKALSGDESAIVIDTHICKAFNVPQNCLSRKGVIPAICRRIESVACKIDSTPRDCQAMLWGGVFLNRLKRSPAGFPMLQEYRAFKAIGYDYPRSGSIDLAKLLRDVRQARLFNS